MQSFISKPSTQSTLKYFPQNIKWQVLREDTANNEACSDYAREKVPETSE